MQGHIKNRLKRIKKKNILVQKKDLFELTNSKNALGIIIKCLDLSSICVYTRPAYNYRTVTNFLETNNIFHLINNFYYGYCHEITFLMKYLLKLHKIKSRIIRLYSKKIGFHWALEIKLKDRWIFADPTLGILLRSKINKKLIGIKEIKKSKIEDILWNKKISLKKFSNLEKNNFFYYRKRKNFLNPKKKYFSYFYKSEIIKFFDKNFSYKKRIYRNNRTKDFMIFKGGSLNANIVKIFKSEKTYGLAYGKKIKSNKFIKFKNYITRLKIPKNKFQIKSFAFPILDIKVLFQNNKKITNLRIDKKNYDISKYNNKWLDKKRINGRTLSINAFRSFSIKSQNILKSVELLILRT